MNRTGAETMTDQHRTRADAAEPTHPTQHVPFGVKDARGREVGYVIRRSKRTFVPAPADAGWWSNVAPGLWFEASASVTRDGRHFGASQPLLRERTEADLERAIARRLGTARQRALRQFGKA